MKKITTVAVFMLLLFQTKAQSVSVNYVYNFVKTDEVKFKGKNFMPQTVSQISLGYAQNLKKLPITINVAAAASLRKPPPLGLIKYPDPYVISKYAIDNKIEADSASFSSSKSTSVDFLLGVGYVLPHKAGSRIVFIANADFGVSINNKQALNYYFQKKLTGSAEVKKMQMIINPSIKAKFSISDRIGINLGVGYSNLGGVNLTTGISLNPFNRKGCTHLGCCGMCDWFGPKQN
jgi:hypothetical protein